MFSWSRAECGVFLCEVFCFFRFQRKISTNVTQKWNYEQSLNGQCNAHDEDKAIKLLSQNLIYLLSKISKYIFIIYFLLKQTLHISYLKS